MPRGSKTGSSAGTRVTKSKSSGAAKPSSSSTKASSSGAPKSCSSSTKASSSGIDELVSRTDKMKLEDNYAYRVCRKDEDISKDIVCKAKQGTPEAQRTVNQHINSGGKKASRFISATASPDVAHNTKENPKDVRERDAPQPIIKIDLSKLEDTHKPIDLTSESERGKYVSGATQINRVKSSQEMLFKDRIPKQNSRGETVFEKWDPSKPE